MRGSTGRAVFLTLFTPLGFAWACGGKPNATTGPDGAGGSGQGGTSAAAGSGGTGNILVTGGSAGTGNASGTGGGTSACSGVNCPRDQTCQVVDGGGVCVPNDCMTLDCGDAGVCVPTDGGAFCEDNTCSSDVDCPMNQFCSGTVCTDDVCSPGDRRCQGQELLECDPNGGGESTRFSCGSANPGFTSTCTDPGAGDATCPCEDDWDCPEFSECEAGSCEGTGTAPTCRLPPEPFSNVLPTNEIEWGGTGIGSEEAVGSPYEDHAQVVLTPVVANLDDDNGDGLIDERDFPEVIFTTFAGSSFTTNGVLRAIHGGGPNKGGDFFAVCGRTTWHEGEPLLQNCSNADADIDSTASLAVGDLDDDGVPEIVAIGESNRIHIYSNTGDEISRSVRFGLEGENPAPSLANVDRQGNAEIVIGPDVFTVDDDGMGNLVVVDRFQGDMQTGVMGQGALSCVANLLGDDRMEIVAGSTVYGMPRPPAGATTIADCGSNPPTTPEETAFCNGELTVEWDGRDVNGNFGSREGFCAVADVLGADQVAMPGPNNLLDQVPEVILISAGRLLIFNGQDGTLRRNINLAFSARGGAPNVDDFDGDGFPEVGTAGSTNYVLTDLQDPTAACPAWPNSYDDDMTGLQGNPARTPPGMTCTQDSDCGDLSEFSCNETTGQCVCLHNGWMRQTEDGSSRVTGSSVFDFNGDGAAEVVYNDECFFRVYAGLDGTVEFKERSPSRTRTENPAIADVDNDGNAEIVFATSNESGFCNDPGGAGGNDFNNGLEVWGDAGDFWVSARRIWNQHAYHVTNITESGLVPRFEPPSWEPLNGRLYNTYRSQPRSFGVAPDLIPTAVQISSPDAACGTLSNIIEITVEITNQGDLRVGPGVEIGFEGTWASVPLTEPLNDSGGMPLRATLTTSLEPGDVVLVTVTYDASDNAPGVLPDSVRIIVDDGDRERECFEDNNELVEPVEAGTPLPDLSIQVGTPTGCPAPSVPTTVCNDGALPASDIVIRYYAGDPNAGGEVLQEETIPGPIAPGACESITPTINPFPANRDILIFGVADPDGSIEECQDANNTDTADQRIRCSGVF